MVRRRVWTLAVTILGIAAMVTGAELDAGWTLIGWNDLGMHCMDADYSLMSILPPYNNIHAQLVDASGNLITNPGGITVSYEAVADPDGSVNTTSIGKTGFWDHVFDLFGASPAPDTGLAGFSMPGAGNPPQSMSWDASWGWFTAEGVPLTPVDDLLATNRYPMMRLVARDASNLVLASTEIVLPVSEEMDCRACHGSGSGAAAEPSGGWAYDPDPERDYRLNILRIHDELEAGNPDFVAALAAAGHDPAGLEETAVVAGRSVLCASCHGSNALPGLGLGFVPALTRAVHGRHALVLDPVTGMSLNDSDNRSACYRCHPGAETRCLRGAMGAAVAVDGSLAMQCQNCHGSMSDVGSPLREGWLSEPGCGNCHTGTAVDNSGQIRYTDAFSSPGVLRTPANTRFATDSDTPAPGFSLYRFSTGHGTLQCTGCHGSTHAVFPSAHASDNLQSIAIQGHAGQLAECSACHASMPNTTTGGPHGLHPIGQSWVSDHHDAHNFSGCADCHGANARGTVLSRTLGDRVLNTHFGTKVMWKGFQVSCYACHNGPDDEDPSPNHWPVVANATMNGPAGSDLSGALTVSDADSNPLELRVVSQPAHGTAWLVSTTAWYRAEPGYAGPDQFTYAAWDGYANSNLGTVTVSVEGGATVLFSDGFESGDTSMWSAAAP